MLNSLPEISSGVSLILGGARSGKSVFAERMADQSQRQKIYLATGEIRDSEMKARIEQHKARRGTDWQLVEEPLALGGALQQAATSDTCVLVDCLTLWLTNLMMAERDVSDEADALAKTVSALQRDVSVLLVSNEVGQGIVPVDKMARDFRDHAGRLHQMLAEVCTNVWFVTAGLPQQLK